VFSSSPLPILRLSLHTIKKKKKMSVVKAVRDGIYVIRNSEGQGQLFVLDNGNGSPVFVLAPNSESDMSYGHVRFKSFHA